MVETEYETIERRGGVDEPPQWSGPRRTGSLTFVVLLVALIVLLGANLAVFGPFGPGAQFRFDTGVAAVVGLSLLCLVVTLYLTESARREEADMERQAETLLKRSKELDTWLDQLAARSDERHRKLDYLAGKSGASEGERPAEL